MKDRSVVQTNMVKNRANAHRFKGLRPLTPPGGLRPPGPPKQNFTKSLRVPNRFRGASPPWTPRLGSTKAQVSIALSAQYYCGRREGGASVAPGRPGGRPGDPAAHQNDARARRRRVGRARRVWAACGAVVGCLWWRPHLPQVGCRVGEFTVVSFSKIKSDHPIRDVLKTAP